MKYSCTRQETKWGADDLNSGSREVERGGGFTLTYVVSRSRVPKPRHTHGRDTIHSTWDIVASDCFRSDVVLQPDLGKL